MQSAGNIKILFIAGFGPIVRDTAESRQLYSEILGISFKEESGEYLHTEALKGAKSFALWPQSQAARSCFGKDSRPDDIPVPQAWLEFDVDSVEIATATLESQGYRMLIKNKKNRGAKPSVVFFPRSDYRSVSLSLHGCERRDSTNRAQKSRLVPRKLSTGSSAHKIAFAKDATGFGMTGRSEEVAGSPSQLGRLGAEDYFRVARSGEQARA